MNEKLQRQQDKIEQKQKQLHLVLSALADLQSGGGLASLGDITENDSIPPKEMD